MLLPVCTLHIFKVVEVENLQVLGERIEGDWLLCPPALELRVAVGANADGVDLDECEV